MIRHPSKGQEVIVTGNTYGNEFGKATVVYPDYRGFKGKQGCVVAYFRKGHGFVANFDIMPLRRIKRMHIDDKQKIVKAPPTVHYGNTVEITPGALRQNFGHFTNGPTNVDRAIVEELERQRRQEREIDAITQHHEIINMPMFVEDDDELQEFL